MKTLSIITIVFIISLFASVNVAAQPGSGPGGGDKPGVPISGIGILVAAGGALGLWRAFSRKKQ